MLLTGAIRPLTRPLAPLFDHIVAAELAVDDRGRATGYLATPPLVGESRAAWLVRYAEVNGFDLSRSFGYADSHSDLPLLRAVGRPTAVSPDVPLFRAARAARWPVETWRTPSATSRGRVPTSAPSPSARPRRLPARRLPPYAGADLHELDSLVDEVIAPHVLERVCGPRCDGCASTARPATTPCC